MKRRQISRSFALVLLLASGMSLPAQLKSRSGTADSGSSARHRAVFAPGDHRLDWLSSRGAIVQVEDYGSFLYAVVDEAPAGGRAVLDSLGLDLRDGDTVVGFHDAPLDTADPKAVAAALAAIPALLRLDPEDAGLPFGRELAIVHFMGPVKDAWLDRLAATGARVVSYVAANAYVVSVEGPARAALAAFATDPAVLWTGPYEPWFRLAPPLRPAALLGAGTLPVTIQVVADEAAAPLLAEIAALGLKEIRPPAQVGNLLNLQVELPASLLAPLARDPHVFAIEPFAGETLHDEVQGQILAGRLDAMGRAPSGPGYLAWLASKGFSTQGQAAFVVDVTDDGVDRGSVTDVPAEFRAGGVATGSSRVAYVRNYTSDPSADGAGGHGNINASILGGHNALSGSPYEDYLGYNYGLGICPFAAIGNTKVFANSGAAQFTAGTATRLGAAFAAGARMSSNSWGFVSGNGYPAEAQLNDWLVRDARPSEAGNQELTILFAAGNAGPSANTVRPPATAKNVIAVGASESWRPSGTDGCGLGPYQADMAGDVTSFSSRGPTADGRRKPDLLAPGTHVQGAASRSPAYTGRAVCNPYWPSGQTLYTWSSGTSHACPAAAGAAALVRQDALNRGIPAPSPAMVKAVLMGTARHLTGAFANDTLWSDTQGMGRIDLGRAFDGAAVLRVDQTQVLGSTGQTFSLPGSIASGSLPFRVALVWTDAPGPTTGNAWVNNLDLEVTVNGVLHRGNVFSGDRSVPGGAADFRNNAEFVFLPAGTTGSFSILVRASNIAADGVPGNSDATDQDFALLVYNGSAGAPPTPPPPPPADFALAASPSSRSVARGGSTSFAIAAAPSGGFSSPVTLSANPAIPGVTFTFSPNPVAAGASSTLGAAVSASASPGTYTVTVTGTGGGLSRSTTVSLTVTAAADFALAASPSSRSVARGGSTSFAIATTASGGFASPVTLSASPAIPGVTFTFSPNPVAAGASSTLGAAASASASPGTYTVTVTGTGGGLSRSTTVSLTVTAAAAADFTLAANPASRSVARGGSTSFAIATTPSGGFSSSIALSASPAIPGVTFSWSSNPVSAGGTSTLGAAVSYSASPGTYSVTVTGSGGGLTRSTTVSLTVTSTK